jgi:ankyrin repeat protein
MAHKYELVDNITYYILTNNIFKVRELIINEEITKLDLQHLYYINSIDMLDLFILYNVIFKNEKNILIGFYNMQLASAPNAYNDKNKIIMKSIKYMDDDFANYLFYDYQSLPIMEHLLLTKKIDVLAQQKKYNNDESFPLLHACQHNNIEIIQFLLSNGADINLKNNTGETALSRASQMANTPVIRLLIDNKADVNIENNTGKTPLFYGNTETMQLLVDNGANVNHTDDQKMTPLFYSCIEENKEVVQLLIYNKADVNHVDIHGKTPLFYSCEEGNKDIAELLLTNGANINYQDNKKNTVLIDSCINQNFDMVNFLLKHGANVNIINSDEKTALDVANNNVNNNNNDKIIQLLKPYYVLKGGAFYKYLKYKNKYYNLIK